MAPRQADIIIIVDPPASSGKPASQGLPPSHPFPLTTAELLAFEERDNASLDLVPVVSYHRPTAPKKLHNIIS